MQQSNLQRQIDAELHRTSRHIAIALIAVAIMMVLLIPLLISCTRAMAPRGVGKYQVEKVDRLGSISEISLVGVRGTYQVHTDTLKPGDIIEVSWLKRKQ